MQIVVLIFCAVALVRLFNDLRVADLQMRQIT
jgi:hypothetical protein